MIRGSADDEAARKKHAGYESESRKKSKII
jgi:hypothetical protein